MSYGHDALASMIRRVRLMETDDSGTQQKVRVRGLRGEELSNILSVQRWGESGVAPAGAEAILFAPGGRSDRAVILGLEHKDHRPTGLGVGDRVIYDAHGNVASLVQAEFRIKAAQKLVLQVGGCSIEITSSGFKFSGGEITHDGKHIDKSHVHGGITPGGSNTAVPAN